MRDEDPERPMPAGRAILGVSESNSLLDGFNMLDLLKLKTFHVVVNRRNFTRAAAELGYSQSSVTTHVKALERELGAALIEHRRFSRTVVLTSAGRRVFEYAGRLLALADETKAAVKTDESIQISAL